MHASHVAITFSADSVILLCIARNNNCIADTSITCYNTQLATENTQLAMTTIMAMQHTGILAFRQTELRLHTSSLQEHLTCYRVDCYPIVCVNNALSWLWLLTVNRQQTVFLIIHYNKVFLTVQNSKWVWGKIRRCLPVLILALAQLLTLTVSKSIGNGANLVTGKLKLLFEILKSFYSTTLMYCAIGKIGPAIKSIGFSCKVHPGKNQRYQ